MTAPPLVSVGLPTFNRAGGLERAAASVLAQTWDPLELVICDNASTDETESVGRALALADPRVRYVRHNNNVGAAANFRSALELARGELFMWLADDDWLGPGVISATANRLLECPDYALVCARSRYRRGAQTAFWERAVNLGQSSPRARLIAYYRTVTLNGPFYGLMRRSELNRVPPLRSSIGADWLLVAALAYQGKIETVADVEINRSLEGVSKDAASLATAHGLSAGEARNWHLLVARAAYCELVEADTFADRRQIERRLLGVTAASLVVIRFGWKVWLGRLLARVGLFDRARHALERRRR